MTNETIRPVLVVDGPSILHRAFHAYEKTDLRDAGGRPTWAVHGFFALLGGICDKTQPSKVVVGFDDDNDSERRKLYAEYKAQRGERPQELKQQMERVQLMLKEMGVPVLRMRGWEADDVLASVAASCEHDQVPCVVATSDRDAFQLSSELVTVMRLVSGLDNAQMITPAVLEERYGVKPSQYLDYAALRGDTSDNLPGVPGFGEKTAAKLLQACGSVETALGDAEAAAKAVGKATGAKLVAGIESYRRNVLIMRPHIVQVNLGDVQRPEASKVREVLEAAGLTSTARRVPELLGKQTRQAPGPIDRGTLALHIPTQRSAPIAPREPGSSPVWGGMWHVTGTIPGTQSTWPQGL